MHLKQIVSNTEHAADKIAFCAKPPFATKLIGTIATTTRQCIGNRQQKFNYRIDLHVLCNGNCITSLCEWRKTQSGWMVQSKKINRNSRSDIYCQWKSIKIQMASHQRPLPKQQSPNAFIGAYKPEWSNSPLIACIFFASSSSLVDSIVIRF